MYLSNRDLKWAIKTGRLIVDPPPEEFGNTSIDLHLDTVESAKIWNISAFSSDMESVGHQSGELCVGKFDHQKVGEKYYQQPPTYSATSKTDKVVKRANQIIIRPGGFVLWQTKENVGTRPGEADLICFVDGKSTRARTGLLVHMTAPTIHAAWWGQIVLEIANLGPFDLVLEEGDVIAQIVVAKISSIPEMPAASIKSAIAIGQSNVAGTGSVN